MIEAFEGYIREQMDRAEWGVMMSCPPMPWWRHVPGRGRWLRGGPRGKRWRGAVGIRAGHLVSTAGVTFDGGASAGWARFDCTPFGWEVMCRPGVGPDRYTKAANDLTDPPS